MDKSIAVISINDLQDNLLIQIFSFLPFTNLCKIQTVSRKWYHLSLDIYLWRYCDFSCFDEKFFDSALFLKIVPKINGLLVHKVPIPKRAIKTALIEGVNLRQLSLRRCRLQRSKEDEKDIYDNQQNDFKCRLTLLDCRETIGSSRILNEYILNAGIYLKQLGMSQASPLAIRQKISSTMPFLQILDCQDCHWFNDDMMLQVSLSCPNLVALSVLRCGNVSGRTLPQLLANCKKLKALNLRKTRLSDKEIALVDWKRTEITELDMSHCYALDEEGIIHVVTKLKNLRYLRSAVTNEVLKGMLHTVESLEAFELRRRYPVDVKNVCSLLQACKNMTHLDISLTPVEAKYFNCFLPRMPKLRYICFAGHEVLCTADIVKLLKIHCKQIMFVGINYYHANEDACLKEAVLDMCASCGWLQAISLQGLYVEKLIDQLQEETSSSQFMKNPKFQFCTGINFPSMQNSLENCFQYH